MATPNLAALLTKKSATLPTDRGVSSPTPPTEPPAGLADMEGPTAEPRPPESPGPVNPPVLSGAPTASVGDQREYLRSIALYLPRTLHQQLGSAAAERGATRTALILDAINSTHTRLGPALAAPTPPVGSDHLFVVPQNKPTPEPSVQTTIRVTDAQYEAITALIAEHHTNRSRLITTALQLHLAQT